MSAGGSFYFWLGASADADPATQATPEAPNKGSSPSGECPLRGWRKRYRFTIEFEADRDMVPGWGHQVEDWVALATSQFKHQSHYNTSFRIVSTEEFPRQEDAA